MKPLVFNSISVRLKYETVKDQFDHDVRKVTADVGGSIASSTCSYKDAFSKERGRKLAISRALANLPIAHDDKKLFWEDYRNSKPGGRW